MIYRLTMIHINIYYSGLLSNANPYNGFPFQGLVIQCYYMMICCKLKTLSESEDWCLGLSVFGFEEWEKLWGPVWGLSVSDLLWGSMWVWDSEWRRARQSESDDRCLGLKSERQDQCGFECEWLLWGVWECKYLLMFELGDVAKQNVLWAWVPWTKNEPFGLDFH